MSFLVKLELQDSVLLTGEDAATIMEIFTRSTPLSGWSMDSYKVPERSGARFEFFNEAVLEDIKRAQLVGKTPQEYIDERINAESENGTS